MLDVRSPFDGRLATTVADGGKEEIDAAIAAAKLAFDDGRWSGKQPRERARVLLKAAELLSAKTATLAEAETHQVPHPRNGSVWKRRMRWRFRFRPARFISASIHPAAGRPDAA